MSGHPSSTISVSTKTSSINSTNGNAYHNSSCSSPDLQKQQMKLLTHENAASDCGTMKENIQPSPDSIKLTEDLKESQSSKGSLIVFDLETSGFKLFEAEILQIAAVCRNKEFNMYITPVSDISAAASAVHHLYLVKGVLYHKDRPVESYSLEKAMRSFIKWLQEIPAPRILLGHNIKRFDCPFVFAALSKVNLVQKFCEMVSKFVDSLPLYRDMLPEMPNYKQNTLVGKILNQSYNEHNAISDVQSLQKLIQSSNIPDSLFIKHSFTSNSVLNSPRFDEKRKRILNSYSAMKYRKGITTGMANKFASNGIRYEDLVFSFEKGGRAELETFLGQKENGKVKGTRRKKSIDGIVKYLENIAKIKPLI